MTPERPLAVREELQRITGSASFQSSKRSREFLEYIVLRALDGRHDELKERIIGSALFGRAADYDTGADSIVRGVASETRRRLTQFYQQEGLNSRVRIDLTAGHYTPAITYQDPPLQTPSTQPEPKPEAAPDSAEIAQQGGHRFLHIGPVFALSLITITAVMLVACTVLLMQNIRLKASTGKPADSQMNVLPWSAMVQAHRVHIILPDASIGAVQLLLHSRIPLAQYIGGKYIPDEDRLPKDTATFLRFLMTSQYTTASYAITASRIAQLCAVNRLSVKLSYAREISPRTFSDGDDFVLLGTLRANPWEQLFENQLNFVLEFGDHDQTPEPVFRNRSPKPGELAVYSRSVADQSALGESYGQVAFLPGLYQGGHVLFITGTSSLATEAAGEFVTDLPRLRAELARAGIAADARRGFELMLRVRHTGGAPVRAEVIASR